MNGYSATVLTLFLVSQQHICSYELKMIFFLHLCTPWKISEVCIRILMTRPVIDVVLEYSQLSLCKQSKETIILTSPYSSQS